MKPVHDPHSAKYPDRVFYRGRWCTPEQIETRNKADHRYKTSAKGRATQRRRDKKRSLVANMTPQRLARRRELYRRRSRRRIKMSAGGINFHIGYAPTVEAAEYLRKKIKEEASK